MKSAAHRDFVADYVKAVRNAGLRVGLYYSPLDWRYPGFFFPGIYRQSAEELRAQYHRQLNQLASSYGKIDILWFDGGGGDWLGFGGVTFQGGWHARPKDQRYAGPFSWHDEQAVANLRKLQPSIIVNDRTDAAADFRSREGDGALGNFENRFPWELCTTITDGPWGYDPKAKVKSLDYLIRLFVSDLGGEGTGIQILFLSPTPIRTVIFAKNLFHSVLFALEALLICGISAWRFGLPGPVALAATLCWLLFAVPTHLAAGDVFSIVMPYRINLGRIGRQRGSQANAMLSLLIQAGVLGVGAGVLALCALFAKLWLAIPIFLVIAAGAIFAWLRVLSMVDRMANRRREDLVSELVRAE